MAEGFAGQYLLADRLVTGEELVRWAKEYRHPVQLFPLSLSEAQATSVLQRGISRSDAKSFRSAYQLFANNCSTAALSLLDAETGFKTTGSWAEFQDALPIAGPIGTNRALRSRGLVDWHELGNQL